MWGLTPYHATKWLDRILARKRFDSATSPYFTRDVL
nr:MAG TPA: hypothetical protein [Caudoviricetes sp.]